MPIRVPPLVLHLGGRMLCPLLVCVAMAACGGESPTEGGIAGGSFAGHFELRAVDGDALPTFVLVSFGAGMTMTVEGGTLAFSSGNRVSVDATGPLGAVGAPVTLGTGGVYRRVLPTRCAPPRA